MVIAPATRNACQGKRHAWLELARLHLKKTDLIGSDRRSSP
jgi:hypothetical protein